MPYKSQVGTSADSELTVAYDSIAVASNGATAQITNPRMKFYSRSGWSDASNAWRVRGNAVADQSWGSRSLSGGTVTFTCSPEPVALQYGATTTAHFIGECAGVSFFDSNDNDSWTGPDLEVVFPARAYSLPAAPSAAAAARVSDTVTRLRWTNNSTGGPTTAAPYDRLEVRVQVDFETATWSAWAPLSTAAPYYDYATSTNHRYRFQIRAHNSTGYSGGATSNWLSTTPAAPGSVQAVKSGANAVVQWANTAPHRSGWHVQRSDDGGAFGSQVAVAAAATSYTHTAPNPAQSHRYQVRAYVADVPVDGGGTTALYSAFVNTGLLLAVPDAPDFGTTRRGTGDSQTVLAWVRTNPLDPNKPYTVQRVQRAEGNTPLSYVDIGTVPGSATGFVDTTTGPGNHYGYRVRAENSGGASAWHYLSTIATTPTPPANPTVSKAGTDITVGWANTSQWRTGTEIQQSSGGGDYAAETTAAAAATQYVDDITAEAYSHQYRLRHLTGNVPLAAGGFTTLYSEWVETGVVQVQAPPLEPLVTVTPAVGDATRTDFVVAWVHQPVDASAQSAVQLQWRTVGAPSWEPVTPASAATSHLLGAAAGVTNGDTYEVQIRTRGDHASYGPWSASKLFTASGTPSATILAPEDAATVTAARIAVELDYSDPESSTAAAWQLQLLDGDLVTVWTSGTLPGDLHTGDPFDVPVTLADGGTYTVRARVQDGAGLWSDWAEAVFDVDYAEPAAAIIEQLLWDASRGAVDITISNPEPAGGDATAVSQSVQRRSGGGDWQAVAGADQLPIAEPDAQIVVTDRIPPVDQLVEYRVVVWSALPSTHATYGEVETAGAGWLYLNGGAGWATLARLRADVGKPPQFGYVKGRAKALHTFVGDEDATEFAGQPRTNSWRVAGAVAVDPSSSLAALIGDAAGWEQIAEVQAPVCARFPDGRRVFVAVDGAVSVDPAGRWAAVQAQLSKVAAGEL